MLLFILKTIWFIIRDMDPWIHGFMDLLLELLLDLLLELQRVLLLLLRLYSVST